MTDSVILGMSFMLNSKMLGESTSSGMVMLSIFFFKSEYALSMSVPYSYSIMTMEIFSWDMD